MRSSTTSAQAGSFSSHGLRQFAETAKQLGQLAWDEDVAMLVFELNGVILAADANFVMNGDPTILEVARRVVRRRLGGIDTRTTDAS